MRVPDMNSADRARRERSAQAEKDFAREVLEAEPSMKATKEDMAWAIEEAKKIDPNAPRRPLKEFIAELRAKAAAKARGEQG